MGVRRAKQPRIPQDLGIDRSTTSVDCKVCDPNRSGGLEVQEGTAPMESTGFGSYKTPVKCCF